MRRVLTAFAVTFVCASVASGTGTNDSGKVSLFSGASDIKLNASAMVYDRSNGVIKADGIVIVRRGEESLSADRVTIRTTTRDVWATGNVVYSNLMFTWHGERLYCNMGSGRIVTEGLSLFESPPFKVRFDGGRRYDSGSVVEGTNVTMTTCALEPGRWHYDVLAGNAYVQPGKVFLAEDVWFHVGGVPVMYLPYWRQTTDGTGWEFQPGYSTWQGAYLLSSYKYKMTDEWMSRSRIDYRSLRGLAGGQELKGVDRDGLWATDLKTYYASDRRALEPWERDAGMTMDENRYRIRLAHSYYPSGGRSYLYSRINVISDVDFLEDFFRSEFNAESQPESYVLYGTFGKSYMAGVGTRFRVNDFYETVERLPEAYVDVLSMRLGNTPLYYDGHNAAAFLKKTYPVDSESEDYESLRLDSRHTLSIVKKVGFVNVVPRAGTRLTYYSETPSPAAATGETSVASVPGGPAVRNLFETGVDMSFKAFKIWSQPEKGVGGLRHVVEPFVNYTFVPTPNEVAEDLYQFDDVDALGRLNVVQIGMRNKLQKRYKKRPADIVDCRIWTDGNLDAENDEYKFKSVATQTQLRPLDWMALDFEGEFNYRGEGLVTANTHLWTMHGGGVTTDFEHRYSADGRHSLMSDVLYNPEDGYSCRYSTRYNFDEGRIEEQTIWMGRNTDCLVAKIGFGQVPGYVGTDGVEHVNEYKILFGIWLKAVPGVGVFAE